MRATLLSQCLGAVVLLSGLLNAFGAPAKYADPDDSTTHAATQRALSNAKTLDINARVLDIVGVSRGIESALKDLNAKVSEREIKIELAADVLFDFDKHDLRPEAHDSLRKLGAVLKEYPRAPALIAGHTDAKGTRAYNQKLSTNRALAVKQWLVKHAGIEAGRLATQGLAETRPAAPNTKPDGSDDPEGRRKNRRVEISIRKN